MKIAVCPGSFDPITKGHLDIINRAAGIFDKVIVLVLTNPAKEPSFSVAERIELITTAVRDLGNVVVDCDEGLLVDYLKRVGACAIVKGLRAMSDFEYEFQQALTNKRLCPAAETVFFITDEMNMYLSSSIVKQVASLGGEIDQFVPDCVAEKIKLKLCKKREEVK